MPARPPAYTPKAISFLGAIEKNNDRAWFAAHKKQFTELLHEPTVALIDRLRARMLPFAADYNFDPKRTIYRIYRDTRFAKDKTPLKTHYGFQFQHPTITKNLGAGYYFHIGAKEVAIGGGIYMPGPDELLALRLGFVRDEKKVRAMIADKKLVKAMGPVAGESAARLPKMLESAPEHTHDLVRRKQLYYYLELPPASATAAGFEDLLVDRFKLMHPVVDWINRTLIAAIKGKPGEDDNKPRRPVPMF
jgi:uncharacterized protein (TIGR02453 family)